MNSPVLVGILNVTPDSFSDGGRFLVHQSAVEHGLKLAEVGAHIIDIGGESTRPGSEPIPLQEELRRVVPVIEQLARHGLSVSIDTQTADVALAALEAGATMINDVNGLRNPEMFELVATRRPTVCVMHRQGTSATMQLSPHYADVREEVFGFLKSQAARLLQAGLLKEHIWLDPGIGFGKTLAHNLTLLRDIHQLVATQFPVMLGVSRKRFIGDLTGESDPTQREFGTVAAHVLALQQGVKIFRTHNVGATRQALQVAQGIMNPGSP